MIKNSLSLSSLVVASALIMSCGGSENAGEVSTTADTEQTNDSMTSEARINFDLVRVNIPSPGTLTSKLKKAKINYNKSTLLSSGKSGSFSSNYQKAIGLGAFGADLAISAAYNQPQDALDYLSQMGKLANDLGISSAFDAEFSKQLIASINKPDTFQIMLDKAFDKAERNLRSNQRVASAVLLVAGGWVESLYISVEGLNTIPAGDSTKVLYNDVSVHCHTFEYVFELLEAYKSNADCAKLLKEMEASKGILASVGRNPQIDAAELPKLREAVAALRTRVIG